MKDKHNLPKRLVRGKTGQQEAKPPIIGGGQGRIDTSFQDIHWTRAKLAIVSTVLLAPFTLAIVVAFHSGNAFIGSILVGLGVFVGLLYLALRYIDNNEF